MSLRGYSMRSDPVFSALVRVPNRYLLCKLAARATRALHRPGRRIQDTTNDVLVRFGRANSIADLQATSERAVVSIRSQNGNPLVRRVSGTATLPPMIGVSQASIRLRRIQSGRSAEIACD